MRGAVITFLDITERKRAAEALQKAKDELELRVAERTRELSVALAQLRELAAYSESVREEERTRIAREVHDELGSLLVALKMDVNWLDKRLGEQQAREAQAAQTMRERMRCKCQQHEPADRERSRQRRAASSPTCAPASWITRACGPRWNGRRRTSCSRPSSNSTGTCRLAPAPELPEPAAMAVFRIFQEMLSATWAGMPRPAAW